MLHDEPTPSDQVDEPSSVEVRRNAGLAAAIGAVASVVAILYLSRATGTGAWLDWALCLTMGAVAAAYLQAFVDARTPLLVADGLGVRVRQGRTWHGMPWSEVEELEHLPRTGLLRDGRVELFPASGAAISVPLSLSTRVVGADGGLTVALDRLADGRAEVVELDLHAAEDEPAEDETVLHESTEDEVETEHRGPVLPDPRPALARGIGALARRRRRPEADDVPGSAAAPAPPDQATPEPAVERPDAFPVVASATPSPLRDPVSASRVEVRSDLTLGATALKLDSHETDEDGARAGLPEARELRRPGSVNLVEDTVLWGDRVSPIARAGAAVEPIVIDDLAVEPAEDPVIGPELAAARTRLGLSIDQLADRTRIRPHVIESLEVDDFAPCGGDFYARGHLRTLARVTGIDAAPLLASYDERYADAPINPRRVFEAELATGANGSIRGTRGGPNWSVLIAAVMVLVLAWSVARLVMDSPVTLNEAPPLNGSGGPNSAVGDPVPVLLTAAGGGAHVMVIDGTGKKVYEGDLAFGQSTSFDGVVPPVQVESTDGSLEVSLGGEDASPLGETGQRSTRTYAAP